MKKKLSLLLAALLVMTLVPMSSFAYGKTVTKSYDAEIGDTGKTVIVEYKVNPGEDTITNGTVQFDVSNGVKITDFKALNKENQAITGFGQATNLNTDTVSVPVTTPATSGNGGIMDGLVYFTFTLDFNDLNRIKEGDYVLNAVAGGTKISIKDLKLGTITEASFGTLAIKVKDADVKKVSKDGGEISEFTITNYNETQDVVVSLDNSTSFTSAEVRVDRLVKPSTITDGKLIIPASSLVADGTISVIANVSSSKNAGFGTVVAEVKNAGSEVSAVVTEIVDYEVTMKVVAKGKKEIDTILAGKTTDVEVTLETVKGTVAGRPINFELDGAYLADQNINNITAISGIAAGGITGVDTDDGIEFTITPVDNATKIKFALKLKADPNAKDAVATLTASGRDLGTDLVADVVKVEKAFVIENKVTAIKRGESLPVSDIVISEVKVAQISAGDYITIGLNGRLEFVDKPVIEASNGMKLEDVKWTVKNDYTAVSAKVVSRSKNEPAEITISDVAIDLSTAAIHEKTYTASLYIGEATTNTKAGTTGGTNPTAIPVAKEFAEFDLVKCVAEYAKATPQIVFTLGSANYTVNGVVNTLEAPVFTKDNRTMLPIGPLALAMGLEVNYNADTQTATFRDVQTGQIVSVKENADILYNNGIQYKMHTSAVTVNGRIFVPVASITDAFGAKIAWNEAAQTVTIN